MTRFPKVRVVLDHLMHAPMNDGPPYAAAAPMWEMADWPNVYLKLTTAIIRHTHEAPATPESYLGKLLSAFGSERIAWGSNYPAIEGTLTEAVADAKSTLAILPEGDQENIFWKTAARLYPALTDT
jgi:predicted TIM-barrel fold metal-dependent hydrolase